MGMKKNAVLVASCMLWASTSYAATATVSVNFGGDPPTNLTAKALTPVVATVQTNTELNSFSSSVTGDKANVDPVTGKVRPPLKASIGIDSYISDKHQMYAIPWNYAVTPSLQIAATIPIISAKYDTATNRETGMGDVSASVKYLLGSEETVELMSILTGKLATGAADTGLGTGSYDVAITEKLVKHISKFRFTLMGGYSQPINEPKILGKKYKYGATASYMAAAETNFFYNPLWFGVKTAGVHNFDSKIDNISANSSFTTLDVVPEVKYFVTNSFGLNASVIVPVVTNYDVPGASTKRDVVFNFGIVKAF